MARKKAQEPDPIWKGNERFRPFLVPMGILNEDPANANTHNDRSISEIAGSYARFGQQNLVIVDSDGVVRAGNGQFRAAAERLGWTHLAVAESNLEGTELTLFALAANRTAEHSERDYARVGAILQAARQEDADLAGLGWSSEEMEPILASDWSPPPPESPTPGAASYGHAGAGGYAILLGPEQAEEARAAFATLRESLDEPEMSDPECVVELCRQFMKVKE